MKKVLVLVALVLMLFGFQAYGQNFSEYDIQSTDFNNHNDERASHGVSGGEPYNSIELRLYNPITPPPPSRFPGWPPPAPDHNTVDPGGDPDPGSQIPVGSGMAILSILGGAYFVATGRRKEDKE